MLGDPWTCGFFFSFPFFGRLYSGDYWNRGPERGRVSICRGISGVGVGKFELGKRGGGGGLISVHRGEFVHVLDSSTSIVRSAGQVLRCWLETA